MPRIRRAFGRIAFYYAMSSLWIVHPEVLITEVEARPLLYIKSLPDYANKSLKNDAWVDITKKFTKNWDTLTTEEKNNRYSSISLLFSVVNKTLFHTRSEFKKMMITTCGECSYIHVPTILHQNFSYTINCKRNKEFVALSEGEFRTVEGEAPLYSGKDIQAKWKHIRDNFRREYQTQKDDMTAQLDGRGTKEGSMTKWTKKRKKYRHYDQLSFLVPHIKDANACGNYTSGSVSENLVSAPLNIENTPTAPPIAPPKVQSTPTRRKKPADPDEDTLFCLSLVQSLKKMDDDAKISTKIEILNAIRTFSNRSNYAHWQPSQPVSVHRQTTPQQYSETIPTYTKDINQVKTEPTETTFTYEHNIYQSSPGALPTKRIKIENYQCDIPLTAQQSRSHSAQGFLHIFNPVSPSPSSSTITSPLPYVSSPEDNN